MFIAEHRQDVTAYRACLRAGRIFVIDPYTAYILDRLKDVSASLPQYDWRSIRVFFAPNSHTKRMAEDKSLFRFKTARMTFPEMIEKKDRLVIKDNFMVRTLFMKSNAFRDAKLIFSMWEGYLHAVKPFWDGYQIPILKVHGSGHAYIEELKRFVSAEMRVPCIHPTTAFPLLQKSPKFRGSSRAPRTFIFFKQFEPIPIPCADISAHF